MPDKSEAWLSDHKFLLLSVGKPQPAQEQDAGKLMLKIVYFHGFPDFGHGFFSYLMCSGGPGYEDIPHLVRPGLVMLPDLAHPARAAG